MKPSYKAHNDISNALLGDGKSMAGRLGTYKAIRLVVDGARGMMGSLYDNMDREERTYT